jgi:sulfur carrier protein ThiS
MKIEVQIHGNMLKPRGVAEEIIILDENASVAELLREMGYLPEHIKYIIAVRDAIMLKHSATLRDGDIIQLSIPIGGG